MYRLRDFLREVLGMETALIVSDELFCSYSDTERTFQINQMQDTLGCYTFTLVTSGWLTLTYSGRELTLTPGDLYTYAPGFSVTILCASENYQGICLMAEERLTFELPIIRNVIRSIYFPIVELANPKLHLTAEDHERLKNRMTLLMDYLNSDNLFLTESLRTVYTLFLLDVMNVMKRTLTHHDISERALNLFISFIRLLPKHFTVHHNIAFYAEQLNITITHLSRVVRRITGRTVIDYINQMLLMEASWLLWSTDLSIEAISDRLFFADQSSFSRFFTRMKGMTPKAYRMQR